MKEAGDRLKRYKEQYQEHGQSVIRNIVVGNDSIPRVFRENTGRWIEFVGSEKRNRNLGPVHFIKTFVKSLDLPKNNGGSRDYRLNGNVFLKESGLQFGPKRSQVSVAQVDSDRSDDVESAYADFDLSLNAPVQPPFGLARKLQSTQTQFGLPNGHSSQDFNENSHPQFGNLRQAGFNVGSAPQQRSAALVPPFGQVSRTGAEANPPPGLGPRQKPRLDPNPFAVGDPNVDRAVQGLGLLRDENQADSALLSQPNLSRTRQSIDQVTNFLMANDPDRQPGVSSMARRMGYVYDILEDQPAIRDALRRILSRRSGIG